VERKVNVRRILAIAVMPTLWIVALGCGQASADNPQAGFDTRAPSDQRGNDMLHAISAPEIPPAVEATSSDRTLGKNPLWGIPLDVLKATRERPLFSPSRRPPTAGVTSRPVKAIKAVNAPVAPEPTLSLLGTVKGDGEGYALFIDTTTHRVVRLKTGRDAGGWILQAVRGRAAVLEKNGRTESLEMPPTAGPRQ
jgi:hypothetical protein